MTKHSGLIRWKLGNGICCKKVWLSDLKMWRKVRYEPEEMEGSSLVSQESPIYPKLCLLFPILVPSDTIISLSETLILFIIL